MIIGGGVVGGNTAKITAGMGADVIVFDRSLERLRQLDDIFGNSIKTTYSTVAIEDYLAAADLDYWRRAYPRRRDAKTNPQDAACRHEIRFGYG